MRLTVGCNDTALNILGEIPGYTVQISLTDGSSVVGEILAFDASDSEAVRIYIDPERETLSIPIHQIEEVHVP